MLFKGEANRISLQSPTETELAYLSFFSDYKNT